MRRSRLSGVWKDLTESVKTRWPGNLTAPGAHNRDVTIAVPR